MPSLSARPSSAILLLCLLLLQPLVAYAKQGEAPPQLRRRGQQQQQQQPILMSSLSSRSGGGGGAEEDRDKVVLLNDLSLEQAYLHHAAEGRLGAMGAKGVDSLAQQAARLAAGAYNSDVGGSPGWRVRGVYKQLNSVAVISMREAGRGCALAFRGSDDRLDWRNDYRARPLPLVLCASRSSDAASGGEGSGKEEDREELFFLDGPLGAGDRPGLRRCDRRLGMYTVHFGFYDSFRLLSHGTALEEDWRALVRNGTCDPSIALLTGHSLGGAFVVFAKILQWPGIPVTFAAPRAVANGSCPLLHAAESPFPITRIYLTDDPVPATLPMSDSLRVGGVGGPWVHCGCALALQAYYKDIPLDNEGDGSNDLHVGDDETFAAVAVGCGSNAPLRAREGPAALLLPPPPDANSQGYPDGNDDDDAAAAVIPGLPPLPPLLPLPGAQGGKAKKVNTQPGILRHLHTRYVRAVDEACQGPLDSLRCLFDHEA